MKSNKIFSIVLSVFVSFIFVFVVTYAATTISTNISTGGTLTVTDTSTLTGAVTMSSTLNVTGLTTLANATTTNVSISNALWVGGNATTTSAGAISTQSTLNVTGLATFLGGATTTSLTLLNGETITNATNGTVTIGADNLVLVGTASTSAIKVGDEPAAPTINGMVFGYCSFTDVTSFTASTTKYADCTTTPAGALVAGDRVFVQATSSFDSMFVINAASTTGVSTINLRILNTGLDGAADATLGGTSINFWAVR